MQKFVMNSIPRAKLLSRYILSGNNEKTEFNENGYLIHVIKQ